MKQMRYVHLIPAIFLFGALFDGLPYGYFQLLRWIVTVTAITIAIDYYKNSKQLWTTIMIGIAILFNPIAPIGFPRKTWIIIDAIIGIFFVIVTIIYKDGNKPVEIINAIQTNRAMTDPEKQFYDGVLMQVISPKAINAQYYVENANGSKFYYIDFAVIFSDGTKIGIELDGFGKIKIMTPKRHNQTVMRENDLEMIGWKMYHFTWDQFCRDKQYCIKTMRKAVEKVING